MCSRSRVCGRHGHASRIRDIGFVGSKHEVGEGMQAVGVGADSVYYTRFWCAIKMGHEACECSDLLVRLYVTGTKQEAVVGTQVGKSGAGFTC